MPQSGGKMPATGNRTSPEWRLRVVSDGRVLRSSFLNAERGACTDADDCHGSTLQRSTSVSMIDVSSAHVRDLRDILASLAAARACIVVGNDEELALLKRRCVRAFFVHVPYLTTEDSLNLFFELVGKTQPGGHWAFLREERGSWRPYHLGSTRTYHVCAKALKDVVVKGILETSINYRAEKSNFSSAQRVLRHRTWRTFSNPTEWIMELNQLSYNVHRVSEARIVPDTS